MNELRVMLKFFRLFGKAEKLGISIGFNEFEFTVGKDGKIVKRFHTLDEIKDYLDGYAFAKGVENGTD